MTGALVDPQGRPIVGAQIRAQGFEARPTRFTTTDDTGFWQLRRLDAYGPVRSTAEPGVSAPVQWRVVYEVQGLDVDSFWVDVYADETTEVPEVRLDVLPSLVRRDLSGWVIGSEGEGLENVEVSAGAERYGSRAVVKTDGNGQWRLADLDAEVAWQLQFSGCGRETKRLMVEPGGRPADDLEVELKAEGDSSKCPSSKAAVSAFTGEVLGRVVGPEGEPLEHVVITATSPTNAGQRVVMTDRDGRFRIGYLGAPRESSDVLMDQLDSRLGHGRWRLTFEAYSMLPMVRKVELLADRQLDLGTVELEAEQPDHHGDLQGTVLDRNGQPLSGVRVKAGPRVFSRSFLVHSDDQGRFQFEPLEAGAEWTFSVRACGFQRVGGLKHTLGAEPLELNLELEKSADPRPCPD